MLSFLFRKMWNNKWMMLSLLVGNILLIGIVSSAPMYVRATLQRVLVRDMQQFQLTRGQFPALATFTYSFTNTEPRPPQEIYFETRNYIIPEVIELLEVPMLNVQHVLQLEEWQLAPTDMREANPRTRTVSLHAYAGFEEHISIVHGRMPSDTMLGNVIEVVVNQNTLVRQNMLLDEYFTVLNVRYHGEDLQVRPVGIFEAVLGDDVFWLTNPDQYSNIFLLDQNVVYSHFVEPYTLQYRLSSTWYMLLDYYEMCVSRAAYYIRADWQIKERFNQRGPWTYSENFAWTIWHYMQRADRLSITLWVLQAPIYVLLAFYIFMVSKQILMLEQNDISVLKSRGASRGQIIGVYWLQSVFVGALSLLLGIPLGMLVVRLLGASNGFLEMVQRAALQVELTQDALLYSLLAAFLSMLCMLLPVIKFSRMTIVDHKRGTGKISKALWQRAFLDILCLAVAVYSLYSFNNQRELMAIAMVEIQSIDPVLFLSASLFIIGLGLLCLRLFPYVVKLVYIVGRRHWSPAMYASMLKVMRSSGEEQFIMIFLVFTMAVGIFSAQSARTINLNNDHLIMYRAGADLVFQERWIGRHPAEGGFASAPREVAAGMAQRRVYTEPDFQRFTNFEEVDALARVFRRDIIVARGDAQVRDVRLMGIDSQEFGETVWNRDDLLPIHMNHFLNSMAQRADAVLLSDNFRTRLGFAIGDGITYRDEAGNTAIGVVHGFVEHWPGYVPVEWTRNIISGEMVQSEVYLLVANLGYLQTMWGIMPYEVWMRTNTVSNRFFYEFARDRGLRFDFFHDAKAAVVESRNDPILQGTNGVLTVGFIVTLLVCFTGFLIYWILSIRARVLQFGIFRAMGLSMRDIIGLLINEQLFITLTAVLIGAGVGELASRLFVPLIQISYSAAEQIIPLRIVTYTQDYLNLYGIIAMMIALCLIILGVIISKIKIAQALKLGED